MNDYLVEFYTYRLRAGIAGIKIETGEEKLVYLFFIYYDSEDEKNNFFELIENLNSKLNVLDKDETDRIIKSSFFGKRWYSFLNLRLSELEIFSYSDSREINITESIQRYFELIHLKTIIHEG